MAGPIDLNKFANQSSDPMESINKQGGTYKDPVEGMSQKELIDFMPKAPTPTPFTLRSK